MGLPVWYHFVFNILLQILDGVFTYQVLHLGVPEANPLVSSAMAHWGAAWGLIYWKAFACTLLLLIFAFRHKERALTVNALTLTATVYTCFALASACELLVQLG